jgi:hypothetical protein
MRYDEFIDGLVVGLTIILLIAALWLFSLIAGCMINTGAMNIGADYNEQDTSHAPDRELMLDLNGESK